MSGSTHSDGERGAGRAARQPKRRGGLKAKIAHVLGAAHIAGSDVRTAIEACRAEARAGLATTIGPWCAADDAPASVAATYSAVLEAIADADLDYRTDLLDGVLDDASRLRQRVHFDSVAHDSADPTLELFEYALTRHPDLSFTLPSRWQRSLADAERIMGLGVKVRVVKGQWADPNQPKRDPRRGFLELIDVLSQSPNQVLVATHDRRLAVAALDRLRASGTDCGLEQLKGLPRIRADALPDGVSVRVYVPFGEAFLPYAATQVLRRPAIVWWMVRDLVRRT